MTKFLAEEPDPSGEDGSFLSTNLVAFLPFLGSHPRSPVSAVLPPARPRSDLISQIERGFLPGRSPGAAVWHGRCVLDPGKDS